METRDVTVSPVITLEENEGARSVAELLIASVPALFRLSTAPEGLSVLSPRIAMMGALYASATRLRQLRSL